MNQPVKISPPPECKANFGYALRHIAAEIAKLPKEAFEKKEGVVNK